jgi:hypothetical protein
MSQGQRCFTQTLKDGQVAHWCIPVFPIIPSPFPPFPWSWGSGSSPDDVPRPLEISGVAPELLRELAALDNIHNLSELLSPEIAGSLREVVARGIAGVQGKLPKYISLSK